MFELPALPYAYDALKPVMSEQTLKFHHDKHHKAYVDTTNKLLEEAGQQPSDLESVIRDARGGGAKKLFNNAAQAWNHGFFWECMTPDAGKPDGDFAAAIAGAFGDLAGLKTKFVEEGVGHFGSGWAWLIADRAGALQIRSTHDAEDMVTEPGLTPLIVCDVWEHAYYLDHQNNRKGFLEAWFDNLANWTFASAQYAAVRGQSGGWRYPASIPAEQKRAAAR